MELRQRFYRVEKEYITTNIYSKYEPLSDYFEEEAEAKAYLKEVDDEIQINDKEITKNKICVYSFPIEIDWEKRKIIIKDIEKEIDCS